MATRARPWSRRRSASSTGSMAAEGNAAPPALPPQIVLYQMATGHYLSRALDLAATLGVADRLKDGPRPAGELAQATATHPPSLHRLLRFLASTGVLSEQADGSFGLTPIGECLRTDIPGSAHAMVKLFAGARIQDNWKELEYCRANRRAGLSPARPHRSVLEPDAGGGRELRRGDGELHPIHRGGGRRRLRLHRL